jgi:hypothetical protein
MNLDHKRTKIFKFYAEIIPTENEGRILSMQIVNSRPELSSVIDSSLCLTKDLRTETDPVSETSCFSSNYLKSGRWTKSENPVFL